MKIKLGIIIILFSVLVSNGHAQKWKLRRYELIGGVGTANLFGEIGGAKSENNWLGLKDIDLLSSRPLLYVGGRYKVIEDVSIKINFVSGFFSAKDEGSLNADRGYSVNSFTQEFSVQGEYYFIPEDRKFKSAATFNRRGMINDFSRMAAYVSVGLGGIYFNPKVDGVPDPLPNNRSEEEFNGFSKTALTIPFGLGAKYILSSKWALNLEIGGRYTTTDYLDGFKSKFSTANDVYYFSSISLVYRIKTDRNGRPILFK